MEPLVSDQPSIVTPVVVRIVGATVSLPEFPELSDYIVATEHDGQYILGFVGDDLVTTPEKAKAWRFNGAEGAMTVMPRLLNLLIVLEPADPRP